MARPSCAAATSLGDYACGIGVEQCVDYWASESRLCLLCPCGVDGCLSRGSFCGAVWANHHERKVEISAPIRENHGIYHRIYAMECRNLFVWALSSLHFAHCYPSFARNNSGRIWRISGRLALQRHLLASIYSNALALLYQFSTRMLAPAFLSRLMSQRCYEILSKREKNLAKVTSLSQETTESHGKSPLDTRWRVLSSRWRIHSSRWRQPSERRA